MGFLTNIIIDLVGMVWGIVQIQGLAILIEKKQVFFSRTDLLSGREHIRARKASLCFFSLRRKCLNYEWGESLRFLPKLLLDFHLTEKEYGE
jgi:hypothetical protein